MVANEIRRPRTVMLCLLLPALLLVFGPGTSRAAAEEADVQTVVLISVDGLAAFYFDDPDAELPNLRALAEAGGRARGMQTSFPSVTWSSHTSVFTGATPAKHGVVGNAVLNVETGQRRTYIGDRELTGPEAVRVPTLADAVAAEGGAVGGVNWPLGVGFESISWLIPDSFDAAVHGMYTKPQDFAEQLEEAGIPATELPGWGWRGDRVDDRDDAYTEIAAWLIEREQPELVLLHLIGPDHAQHAAGPYSEQAYEAVRKADERIGRLWRTIESGPLAGRVAVFVVSDHGFAPYDHHLRLNVLFAEKGWIELDDDGRVQRRSVWAHSHGGAASAYVFDDSVSADEVRDAIADVRGIDGVFGPEQFARFGLPHPDDNPEQGQLMLSAQPGYTFEDSATGDVVVPLDGVRGAHGHRPDRRWMHAMLIAFGAGIAEGVEVDLAREIDVAPTIARLLRVQLPEAEGRPLSDLLKE